MATIGMRLINYARIHYVHDMKNETYPFYRLVLPNFLLTVSGYILFLLGLSVELLVWLIVGCLIPLVIMAFLCARYSLVQCRSSIRVLLKIVFCINTPLLGVLSCFLFVDLNNSRVWLLASVFLILGCVKDFLLTFIFLPKKTYSQMIQTRYLVLFVLIVSVLMSFITPAPDYSPRTYVAESLALASRVKLASSEFYDEYKRFPENNQEVGLLPAEKIIGHAVKSVEIKPGGIIAITYNVKLRDNAVLRIKGVVDQDKFMWRCIENERFEKSLEPRDLPANCRHQIYGGNINNPHQQSFLNKLFAKFL